MVPRRSPRVGSSRRPRLQAAEALAVAALAAATSTTAAQLRGAFVAPGSLLSRNGSLRQQALSSRYAASRSGASLDNLGSWCVAAINLSRRADRRLQLAHVLAPANTEILARLTRINAVDGRGVDLADGKRLLPFISAEALEQAREAKRLGALTIVHQDGQLVKFHDHLTEGGIACTMSHHAALSFVANHPTAEWGLILEDDIQGIVPHVHEAIAGIVRRLPENWDAVFLGYHGGTLAGTGAGGKDTAEEESKARLELQIDDMRGGVDGFQGSVDGDVYCAGDKCDPPVLRMYGPLYGLYALALAERFDGHDFEHVDFNSTASSPTHRLIGQCALPPKMVLASPGNSLTQMLGLDGVRGQRLAGCTVLAAGSADAEWMIDGATGASDDDGTTDTGPEDGDTGVKSSSSSSSSEMAPSVGSSSMRGGELAPSVTATTPRGFDPRVLRGLKGEILSSGGAPEPEGATEYFRWLATKGCTGLDSVQLLAPQHPGSKVQLLMGGGMALRGGATAELSRTLAAWLTAFAGEDQASVEALAWRVLLESWAGAASPYAPQSLVAVLVLKSSPEGYELVQEQQTLAGQRVAKLLVMPQHLVGDQEALVTELRWILCLIEDVRNSSRRSPSSGFRFDPSSIALVTTKRLKPGEELLQKVAPASAAWLLANLGIVPGAEYPGRPVLPDEGVGTGRMLPTAVEGFIIIGAFSVRFFQHCKLEGGYPSTHEEEFSWFLAQEQTVAKVMTLAYTSGLEVSARTSARTLAADWCVKALLEKSFDIERIAKETGLPQGNSQGVIAVQVGMTVMAYFKAKHQDGTVGRSQKPREAKVLSGTDELVRVEFLANKKRHEIPANWIVSASDVPIQSVLASGCSAERLQRGKLAITLLRAEAAILAPFMEALKQSAAAVEELEKKLTYFRKSGDDKASEQVIKIMQSYLEREIMEVDKDLIAMLPESLDKLPAMFNDPANSGGTFDNPMWRLPPVGGVIDSKFSTSVLSAASKVVEDDENVRDPPLIPADE
ncbi:unnamed protein product [Polarella glacialis]|uniref:Uncharacterized protein n=1 Tax=Polarella glacialis TaxID=89957 RepID=A0A813EMR3_POLGL|nr:unnamed protein product [Polarella glacialis]